MKYTLETRRARLSAAEFVSRYLDVDRIGRYCEQCPVYGQSWGCPPHAVDPSTLTSGFTRVEVTGTTIEFDQATRASCHGAEQSARVGREAMQQVWQQLLPRLYEQERQVPGSRVFTFRCTLCPQGCTRVEGKPCRKPGLLRYSLEAVGFDVEAVTRDLLGIDLEWSTDGTLPRHITLVTALFS